MKRFIIQDWAGNVLTAHGSFKTFEDAWDYILGDMTDKLGLTEDDYSEYYVVESRKLRDTNFLDPNDPRAGKRNHV
jgi:hypothetical protein